MKLDVPVKTSCSDVVALFVERVRKAFKAFITRSRRFKMSQDKENPLDTALSPGEKLSV